MFAALNRETKKQRLPGGGWEESRRNSPVPLRMCRNKVQSGGTLKWAPQGKNVKRAQSNAFYDKYLKSVSNVRSEGIGGGM